MRPEKIVKVQKLSNRETKRDYWDHVQMGSRTEDGEAKESNQANPDNLSENALDFFKRGPQSTKAMQLLEYAVNSLNENQRKIYIACMRDEETQEDVAEHFGITQQAVQQALKRAIEAITKYCKDHEHELDS